MSLQSFCQLETHQNVATQSIKRQNGDHVALGVSGCYLDGGWGDVSAEFSQRFLTILLNRIINLDEIDNSIVGAVARDAFVHACDSVDPITSKSRLTGEFVAAYLDGTQIGICWIGEMFATGWHNRSRVFENRPHSHPTIYPNFQWTTKFFARTCMDKDQTMPDGLGPFFLTHPTVVYLGNWDIRRAFEPEGGKTFLHSILNASNVATFEQSCYDANERLKQVWCGVHSAAGFRSVCIFL